MKVLHISTVDFGGAGTAALRLHFNLRANGLDSRMVTSKSRSGDADVVASGGLALMVRSTVWKAVLRLWARRRYWFQNQNLANAGALKSWGRNGDFVPDVIVAHSISNFLALGDIRIGGRSSRVPIVWHLLDMGPLTGGCHYAWDCRGYTEECGRCPAIRSRRRDDHSHRTLTAKVVAARGSNIAFVAASGWLRRQAAEATVCRGKRIEQILLGVDPEVFRPVPREEARRRLGLPDGARIVFVGALSIKDARKGMGVLIKALSLLAERYGGRRRDVMVVTAGKDPGLVRLDSCGFPRKHLGFLTDDRVLATAYQAADVFVCPSIEDSGPMMINEAIMSGTPVVAFEMGVAVDLVHTGQTGYRALLGDAGDLARGIGFVLSSDEVAARSMASECRALGLDRCHPGVQARAFTELFSSMPQ
jgi:glycosyltransferase involved in cell wall biosynthesis